MQIIAKTTVLVMGQIAIIAPTTDVVMAQIPGVQTMVLVLNNCLNTISY
jgi:hypothetical protein